MDPDPSKQVQPKARRASYVTAYERDAAARAKRILTLILSVMSLIYLGVLVVEAVQGSSDLDGPRAALALALGGLSALGLWSPFRKRTNLAVASSAVIAIASAVGGTVWAAGGAL